MEELTVMSTDPDTRAEYNARVREMNRICAGQTVKYQEGLAEGVAKGRTQGQAEERARAMQEKYESAKRALYIGLSSERAAQITSLSASEIKNLQQ